MPVVIGKFDRDRVFVALDFDSFVQLLEKLHPPQPGLASPDLGED
jgi:hypothetical protein